MKRIALVTCQVLPEPDPDQDLLVRSLTDRGLEVALLPWDSDRGGDLEMFDACVLRSCWNYHERPYAFLEWVGAAARASRVVNNERVIRWNLHKRYLSTLADAGVPTIPTEWFNRGDDVDLAAVMRTRGWDDVVVKPAVSAASFRTMRFRDDQVDAAQTFLSVLLGERDAMVQRYMPAVEETGERALVWLAGGFTHAVRKSPRFAGGVEVVSDALAVTDREREVGERALACVDSDLLYARVDVVEDETGAPVVSELELIEPSLFLLQDRSALDRFVSAIADL